MRSTPSPFGGYLRVMEPINLLSAVEQVAEHLREALLGGRLSGTMPGSHSLAEELGVNHKTVNSALKQLEQEGLLISQGAGLGRKIVLPKDHAPPGLRIGMIDSASDCRRSGYIIDLRRRLESAGHIPFFTNKSLEALGRDKNRVAHYVRKTEADAWIVVAGSHDILEWFSRQQTPAFALFGAREGLQIAATGPDKQTTLAEVTHRLLSLGHRRISFIARQEVRHPRPTQSIQSFLDVLKSAGISTGRFNLPEWEESIEGFERLLQSLFESPTPPTALILDEPYEFYACYQHLSQRGIRVPQDVSLLCTDADPGFTWWQPPVSHIRWDYRPVVLRIVRWANNLALGKEDIRQTVTQAEFIEGGTIGPVPG